MAEVFVITGIFRRVVVNGRAEMGPANLPAEAVRRLRLRHARAASVTDEYADIILGTHVTGMVTAIRTRPCHVVVLAPRPGEAGSTRKGRLPPGRPGRRSPRRPAPPPHAAHRPVAGHLGADRGRDCG